MNSLLSLSIKQWLITVILTVISHSSLAQSIDLDSFPIQSGDIIFREGTEPVSMAVMSYDDSGYSHVGMLYKQQDKWFVIHATPSEVKGRKDSVVIDELSFYIAKERSKRFAIYKVAATKQQYQQAIDFTLKQLGVIFHFNEQQGTYCTLLIYRAWQVAGIDLQVNFTHLNIPFMAGDYLLPKELKNSKYLTEIFASS